MTVHLVGAGPGDADLLTLRAARLLGLAEAVVHDRLIDPSVLALAGGDAIFYDVGKALGAASSQTAINELLVQLARDHATVVRLKGGDPFVFGRGGEEALALRAAGVAYDIVPGLTSAFAGPLAAGIPVTHRGLARGVTVVAGQLGDDDNDYIRRLAQRDLTLVILMGIARRAQIACQLMEGGLADETPVAVIESAWTKDQCVTRGVLARLSELDVSSPAIIVIGPTAALDLGDLILDVALVR